MESIPESTCALNSLSTIQQHLSTNAMLRATAGLLQSVRKTILIINKRGPITKNTLYFVLLVMIFSIFYCGCKKDEPTQIQQSTSNSSLEYRYMLNGKLVDHSSKEPYSSHYTESIDDSLIYSGTRASDYDLLS